MTRIVILEPTARAGAAAPVTWRSLDTLKGKVVGFIDNAKPNFHHLADDLARAARDTYGVRVGRAASQAVGFDARTGRRDRRHRRAVRSRHHRLRRLRVLHVVECPRQCRGREARHDVAGDLLDGVHDARPRAGARARRRPILPIAVIPHPFGLRTRDEVREIAEKCVDEVVRLARRRRRDTDRREGAAAQRSAQRYRSGRRSRRDQPAVPRAPLERRPADRAADARARRAHARAHAARSRTSSSRRVAPGYGAATVERIAINAVMAGCDPQYLPVLIAAIEAVADTRVQPPGHPGDDQSRCAVWLVVNGPAATEARRQRGFNCLGQGTLGERDDRPRDAARSCRTSAARCPARWTARRTASRASTRFCCAENEDASPWEPLHVERGFSAANEHGHGRRRRRHAQHEHALEGRGRARARDRRDACASPAEQRVRHSAASRGSCSRPSTRRS